MTDLIPFILEDNGDGTATGRRTIDAELLPYVQRLLQWAPANTVLFKAGNSTVGALQLLNNTVVARIGSGGVKAANATELSTLLNLAGLLGAKADTGHTHDFITGIPGIDWTTLADNKILARIGGEFVWIAIPTGGGTGGSGLTNPLGVDLDLNGYGLVSGATELIKVQGGKIYVGGQELIGTDLGGATEGQVPRFDETTGEFLARNVKVTDIIGVTPGQILSVGTGGALEEIDAPSGTVNGAYAFDGTHYFLPELPTSDPNVTGALWFNGTGIIPSSGPTPGAAWSVNPSGNYSLAGTEGEQDFTPETKEYTLSNDGTESISWTASTEVAWVSASPASGTLAAGASVVVTATGVQDELDNLAAGTTVGAITFAGTGVTNITRDIEVEVTAATGGGTNRAAVFTVSATKYGQISWAPTAQDFEVETRIKLTTLATDNAVFGGDIYGNTGLIMKGSGEAQFWVGTGKTSSGFGMTAGAYTTLRFRREAGVLTFYKDGVQAGATQALTNSIPTTPFTMRLGSQVNGSSAHMGGSMDWIKFTDLADDTNTALFSMNADNFANSHPSSTVAAGTNVGGVTFEDV